MRPVNSVTKVAMKYERLHERLKPRDVSRQATRPSNGPRMHVRAADVEKSCVLVSRSSELSAFAMFPFVNIEYILDINVMSLGEINK